MGVSPLRMIGRHRSPGRCCYSAFWQIYDFFCLSRHQRRGKNSVPLVLCSRSVHHRVVVFAFTRRKIYSQFIVFQKDTRRFFPLCPYLIPAAAAEINSRAKRTWISSCIFLHCRERKRALSERRAPQPPVEEKAGDDFTDSALLLPDLELFP